MIADGYDAFLLDLDGVLYRGDQPVAHAAASIEALRALAPIGGVGRLASLFRVRADVLRALGSETEAARSDAIAAKLA